MAEIVQQTVKTQTIDRLQPWQALMGILAYVIGAFDLADWNILLLCGFLIIGLGFTQRSTYKHKEAIKEVVAPWVIEKLLCLLEDYIKTNGEESDGSDSSGSS